MRLLFCCYLISLNILSQSNYFGFQSINPSFFDKCILHITTDSVISHHPIISPKKIPSDNRMADFITDFDNDLPEEVISVIEHTLNLLSLNILSDYPIKIKFNWETLGEYVLANAAPTSFHTGFDNIPLPGFSYGVSLAENICQCSLNGTTEDIIVNINSQQDWYLGLDGATPGTQSDLVTVLMHEIIHGLGFLAAGEEDGVGPMWHFLSYNNSAITLMSEEEEILEAITSNQVIYNGPNAELESCNEPLLIYSPNPIAPGAVFLIGMKVPILQVILIRL